jgi:alkylation response protein AidB-like acyl-CoA dehydrogenase
MMDVDLGPEITEFRREMRAWIESSAPKGLKDLTNWGGQQVAGGRRGAEMLTFREHPLHQKWEERLSDAKLICPQWPVAVGGRGWDGVRVAVWYEELRRSGVPAVRRGMGESLVGPAIIVHGTPQQRAHFLPRIVAGEDVYCQGYSEPDHGSDLGAVETRGVVDGDEIVITGQKVWTSGAQRSNMIFVLCRTDPDAPKHRGLSYVLVPFSPENGVRIQPLRQLSGASGFCQDFLEGARAPLFNIIGGLNNGWAPAMTTLGFERGGNATTAHLGFEQEVWDLIDMARKNGKAADPLVRQQLAWSYAKVQVMRFAGLRLLAQLARGKEPGPEASVNKLYWSEFHKRFGEIAIATVGSAAMVRPDGPGYETDDWQDLFFSSRSGTIYSGTSEIQRNIIGERALGLPKEPSAEREGKRTESGGSSRGKTL